METESITVSTGGEPASTSIPAVDTSLSSSEASFPAVGAPETGGDDFSKYVPDEFREKGYMKEVDSFEKLFKKLDGAQSLIGKRPGGIPQESAGKEEWDKFYAELGRPESADKYEFASAEGAERNADFDSEIKGVFHELGITTKQGTELQTKFDEIAQKHFGEKEVSEEERGVQYDTMLAETFGKNAEQISAKANQLIKENISPELAKHLTDIPNESVLAITALLSSVHDKYASEDSVGESGPGSSTESIRAQARELISSAAYKDKFHPEHDETVKRARRLYEQAVS